MSDSTKHRLLPEPTLELFQRLFANFRIGPDVHADLEPCWLWDGPLQRVPPKERSAKVGYGVFRIGRKKFAAHRLSYTWLVGPILPGNVVCHRCDVRNCVRPSHLFQATQRDNVADAIAKGKHVSALCRWCHGEGEYNRGFVMAPCDRCDGSGVAKRTVPP